MAITERNENVKAPKRPPLSHLFAKKFKQHVDMRGRQEEEYEDERRREVKQENERLLHQGKMNGYLASQKGVLEIGSSFQSDINNLKRPLDDNDSDYNDGNDGNDDYNEEEEGIKHRLRKRTRVQLIVDNGTCTTLSTDGSYKSIENNKEDLAADLEDAIPYVLALKLSRISIKDVRYIPSCISIFERLNLSGTRYTNASSDAVIPDELPTSMSKLIRQWQRAIEYKKCDLFLLPNSPIDVSVVSILNLTPLLILKQLKLKERNTK